MADFRSALEAAVAAQLEAGSVNYEYEKLRLNYKTRVSSGECDACGNRKVSRRRRYLADFSFGNRITVEVKGYFHARDRAKMLDIKKANPEYDIRILFGADNKIRKGSDDRYSDWCNKHGFPYAVRIIPKHWFKAFREGGQAFRGDKV